MARYQVRKQHDGYAVVSVATGSIAVANGHLLVGLDDEDASDLVDLINCVEGEALLDGDDVPDREWPAAAAELRFDPMPESRHAPSPIALLSS